MTRIPHDSPHLESWLADALEADRALAPGPQEIGHFQANIATSAPLVVARVSALKLAAVGVGGALAIWGLAGALGPRTDETPPVFAPVVVSPLSSAQGVSTDTAQTSIASPASPASAEVGEARKPDVQPRAIPGETASSLRRVADRAAPSWGDVSAALAQNRRADAEAALGAIAARSQGVARDKAELALGELELSDGRASEALRRLRRLASRSTDPSVRARARALCENP